jgi:hypothetical protein
VNLQGTSDEYQEYAWRMQAYREPVSGSDDRIVLESRHDGGHYVVAYVRDSPGIYGIGQDRAEAVYELASALISLVEVMEFPHN